MGNQLLKLRYRTAGMPPSCPYGRVAQRGVVLAGRQNPSMPHLIATLVLTALVVMTILPGLPQPEKAEPLVQKVQPLVFRRVLPHPRLFFAPGEFRIFVEETKNARADYFDRLVGQIDARGSRAWNERDLQVQSQTLVARVLLERSDRRGARYLDMARQSLRHYLDRHTYDEFRDSHAMVTGGSRWLETVALAYDWAYSYWTAAERREMADWMRREIDQWVSGDRITRASPSPFRNDTARAVSGLVAVALAIFDEPEYRAAADRAMAYALPFYEEMLAAHAYAGADGGLTEGTFYGSFTAWSQATIAEMLYTGAGLADSFRRSPFFEARLRYVVHAAWPGYITNQYQFDTHQLAPIFGDARRGPTGAMLLHRATVLLLGKRLSATDAARQAYAVVNRDEIDRTYTREWSLYDLLLWSPDVARQIPTALAYRERTLGQVFARSSWDDNATWISFNAGPHLDTHQHYDAGNLTIYRNGVDLLVDSGSLDTFGSRHWYNYYVRTVAHNTILIHDPTERWKTIWSGVPDDMTVNDGGQRTQGPLTPAPTLRRYLDNRAAYDHAAIERYATGDWGLYLKSNLTNAYQNPRYQSIRPDLSRNRIKAEYVGREVVYVRGREQRRDALVVFDRVVAADPSFRKTVLWHAREPFSTTTPGTRVDDGEHVYTSSAPIEFRTTASFRQGNRDGRARLFVTLLPVDPVRVRQIGDRPSTGERVDHVTFNSKHFHRHVKDFYVEDPRVLNPDAHTGTQGRPEWPPFSPPEVQWLWNDDLAGGWGKTRLQVEPVTPSVADRFLTLLVPTSADDSAPPRTELVRSGDSQAVGLTWTEHGRHVAVLFGMENSGGDLRSASVDLPQGAGELLLVGLIPNTGYRVIASGEVRRRIAISPDGDLASGPEGVLRLDLATLAPLAGSTVERRQGVARNLPQDPGGGQGAAPPPESLTRRGTSISATTPREAARWQRWIETGLRDDRLRVRDRTADTLVPGRVIERLAVLADGVPVFGREVVVQRSGGAIRSAFGIAGWTEAVDTGPEISSSHARRAIERLADIELPVSRDPALVLLPQEGAAGVRAYCERIMSAGGPRTVCVDASRGERVLVRDETRAQGTRAEQITAAVYRLDDDDSIIGFVNGVVSLSRRELAVAEPGSTAEAIHHHQQTIIQTWHGRYGVADLIGARRPPVTAIVRPPDGASARPASYLGHGVILYADRRVKADAAGRALVAHELGHVLVERSSGLIAEGESGALEEEFATLLGELAANQREGTPGELRRAFWSAVELMPSERLRLERAFVRGICRLLPPGATVSLARAAILTAYADLGGRSERLEQVWPEHAR